MKGLIGILAPGLIWVGLLKSNLGIADSVGVDVALYITLSIALVAACRFLMVFARAGTIRFGDDRLIVETPVGFVKIPYECIETIRRCKRGGSSKRQSIQIGFSSQGERKSLQLRPQRLSEFKSRLHRKCPHLSSESTVSLVRKSGYGKLIHQA